MSQYLAYISMRFKFILLINIICLKENLKNMEDVPEYLGDLEDLAKGREQEEIDGQEELEKLSMRI